MGTVVCCSTVIMRLLLVIGLTATSFGRNHDIEWTVGSKLGFTCIAPGDSVTFQYQVTENDYDNCSGFTSTQGEVGPVTITEPFKKKGQYFYVCGVGTHCKLNQKIEVRVNANCSPTKPSDQ